MKRFSSMDTVNAASAPSPKPRPLLSNLTLRVLSAVVLLPVLAIVIWLGGWWVAAAVLIVALLALREAYRMFVAAGYRPRSVGYLLAVGLVLVPVIQSRWHVDLLGLLLTATLIGSLAWELPQREHSGSLLNWVLTLGGALYVAWLLAHFVLLRSLAQPLTQAPLSLLFPQGGIAWVVWALLIVFGSDTGAFLVGRKWGRRKLAPRISPNKSWEGAIGGLLTALLIGAGGVWLFGLPVAIGWGAALGVLGSVVGQAGDLAESLIKRQVGVKDSGALIPGHGGMLDRIDSHLFTIPVLYYCVVWLTR